MFLCIHESHFCPAAHYLFILIKEVYIFLEGSNTWNCWKFSNLKYFLVHWHQHSRRAHCCLLLSGEVALLWVTKYRQETFWPKVTIFGKFGIVLCKSASFVNVCLQVYLYCFKIWTVSFIADRHATWIHFQHVLTLFPNVWLI